MGCMLSNHRLNIASHSRILPTANHAGGIVCRNGVRHFLPYSDGLLTSLSTMGRLKPSKLDGGIMMV